MAVVIMLVHTYYGYSRHRGGPAGVGEAVGRAVRTSMITASCCGAVRLAGHLRPDPATSTWRADRGGEVGVRAGKARLWSALGAGRGDHRVRLRARWVRSTRVFTSFVPVTLVSDRAGLVMEVGAKVKLRGVQVGEVGTITGGNDTG